MKFETDSHFKYEAVQQLESEVSVCCQTSFSYIHSIIQFPILKENPFQKLKFLIRSCNIFTILLWWFNICQF
jgi:hypothetical protein